MAKIKELKFSIKDREYKVNVNCTSQGLFTAYLPREVCDALDLRSKLEFKSLSELQKEFFDAIHRYREAETHQDLFILIRYGSTGDFNEDSEGNNLHNQGYRGKYNVDISFGTGKNVLSFDYKICIRESVDGIENWYDARYGKKSVFDSPDDEPDAFHKGTQTHSLDEYKKIPYSEESLETLNAILEKIRAASEILYNFIEQDEKSIEQMLTGQTKLLEWN